MIAVGYIVSLILGAVTLHPISEAKRFAVPWIEAIREGAYALPAFDLRAILFIAPVTIAPAIEHVGDVLATSFVIGKDYLKEPGLHRTRLGDSLATSLAGFLGEPPTTTGFECYLARRRITGLDEPQRFQVLRYDFRIS